MFEGDGAVMHPAPGYYAPAVQSCATISRRRLITSALASCAFMPINRHGTPRLKEQPPVTQQSPRRRSASRARKPPRLRAPMQRVAVPDGSGDEPPSPPKLIFKPEVLRRIGCTFPTLWRWMRNGTFPLSFDVGGKTAWAEHEIDAWLATRPRSNLKRRNKS